LEDENQALKSKITSNKFFEESLALSMSSCKSMA
jgi:hypothetical protein